MAEQPTNRRTNLLGWDAMRRRDVSRAVLRNAEAIEWVKTHTIRDLEDLVNEMSNLGADVEPMAHLLDDLRDIEQGSRESIEHVPAETSEYAAIAG